MADRYPLVVASGVIQELPVGDNLNFVGSGITNVTSIASTTLTINTVDMTPVVSGVTTVYVTTTGNDNTGDGTESNPFATPHRAFDYINAKDVSDNAELHVSVGIGSYSYGLYITNGGSGYTDNRLMEVSGGSGSGAKVGIVTAAGTTGVVTNVVLVNPGTGYAAGDSLGVTTTAGSGLAFTCFAVSPTGGILGPVYIGHKDGPRVKFIGGALTGTKPGNFGNHFYNQAGVGVGSDPGGTGKNFDWSAYYDSTSPSGAYPNPMASGQGPIGASKAYNEGILRAYYGTHFYFYGCDGFTSREYSAEVNKMLLIGRSSNGEQGTQEANYTVLEAAFTNASGDPKGTVTANSNIEGYTDQEYVTNAPGFFTLGREVSVSGFGHGINIHGGSAAANNLTVTNAVISGVTGRQGASIRTRDGVLCNNTDGAVLTEGSTGDLSGCVLNNNRLRGAVASRKSYVGVGFDSLFAPYAGVGGSCFASNNGTHGVTASLNSFLEAFGGSGGSEFFVYGNGTAGAAATTASFMTVSGIAITAASGANKPHDPPLNEVSGLSQIRG